MCIKFAPLCTKKMCKLVIEYVEYGTLVLMLLAKFFQNSTKVQFWRKILNYYAIFARKITQICPK